jgi:hypothetical protein
MLKENLQERMKIGKIFSKIRLNYRYVNNFQRIKEIKEKDTENINENPENQKRSKKIISRRD